MTDFYKICDIEPCGIAGRNYPFPFDDAVDQYVGIGGGVSHTYGRCSGDDKEVCTKEDFYSISDGLQLLGDDSDIFLQYAAFNTLYTWTLMDVLHINEIQKPTEGYDNWMFGLASNDWYNAEEDKFMSYFEWSSTRLQFHVFPRGDNIKMNMLNINNEIIGNENKKYEWGTDIDTEDDQSVEYILAKIKELEFSFNFALNEFLDLGFDLEGEDVNIEQMRVYCERFGIVDINTDEEKFQECKAKIIVNYQLLFCKDLKVCHFIEESSPLYATGGLRNNVVESVSLLKQIEENAEGYEGKVSEARILSGSEEAMYGFMAVNFPWQSKTEFKNVFDFGGQSVQVTKVITDADLPAYSNDRQLKNPNNNGDSLDYYALSVNNFGSDAAAEWIEEYWTRKGDENACLLTLAKTGVSDKNLCLESLRFLLEPVAYYETECEPSGTCDPDSGNSCPEDECDCDSALSKLMGTSFVLMLLYIVI